MAGSISVVVLLCCCPQRQALAVSVANLCLLAQEEGGDAAALQDAAAELEAEPKELAALYNDYASPHRLWGLAIELVALANYNDPAYVAHLWDVFLRQASEHALG